MPPYKGLSEQQQKRLLAIFIPLLKLVVQKIMARPQRRANADPQPDMHDSNETHPDRPSEEPIWTWNHFLNPHIYVRELAAFLIPISLNSLALYRPIANPRELHRGVTQLPAFIKDFTKYEVDRQLRLGLPNLRRRHKHRKPKTEVGGLLNRSAVYYDHAEELIAHEVEKQIRDYVRKHVKDHSAPSTFPEAGQHRDVDEGERLAPVGPPSIVSPPSNLPLRFADLDPEQREYLVAAFTQRLDVLVNHNAAELLEMIDRENGNLWGIGHDDLVQRALDRNFDLSDVSQDIRPQTPTNRRAPGNNLDDTPASSYGPFGVASTADSSSTTQTEWPTARRLGTGLGTPSPDSKRSDNKLRTPSSTPKLKQAEPSIGRVFGALGSLRKKKQPPQDKSATQPVVAGDIPEQESTSDQPAAPRDEHKEPISTQGPQRWTSMRRPHHKSLAGVLRQALAPPGHATAARKAPSPKPPLVRKVRRPARKTSEEPVSKQGRKEKGAAEGVKKPGTVYSIANLLRRDPIAETKGRREEAEAAQAKSKSGQASKDKSKGKRPTSAAAPVFTSTNIEPPASIGLGISYEQMTQATPPVQQKQPRSANAPLPDPPVDKNQDANSSNRGPADGETRPPVSIAKPKKSESGGVNKPPLKVASAAGRRPSQAPTSSTTGPRQGQQPQAGRLGENSVETPASATAPAKAPLGTRLLDRLEAAKKQKEAVLENGPGPTLIDASAVPPQNSAAPGSTAARKSGISGKVSKDLGKAKGVAFASSPPKNVETRPASTNKNPAATDLHPSQTASTTSSATIAIPGFSLLPQSTYVPPTVQASGETNTRSAHAPTTETPAAPPPATTPTPTLLFSKKKSTKKKPQQKAAPDSTRPSPKQESPVSPYVSDGSKYGSEGKDKDDEDLPKWSWPSNVPAGTAAGPAEAKPGDKNDPGSTPFGGGGGGCSFGNV